MQKYILSLRCDCYFIASQYVKALRILSTPWLLDKINSTVATVDGVKIDK